ncbi:MAG: MmgE/PrpD family protein [Syntrophorhabdus sp. PtaU1.Bin058]|nr:MAG: MmgE/PrpD family protein [Syntrophorhabdus sp. PtaU1.Bin058]
MIAAKLARFAAEKGLEKAPQAVFDQAKMGILDWFAAVLLAVKKDRASIDPLLKVVKQLGGKPSASIIGSSLKTSVTSAALVNGYSGHLLDYDETTPPVRSHLTSCILPAVLAFAEERKGSGRDVLEGYIVGYEVALRIGQAMTPGWMREGWHGTSLFGIFGAVAGCGRIARYTAGEIRNALGMACSMASGISRNFGTMTKPFHAGHAAKNAVLASLLAKEGFTASEQAVEGFLDTYSWSGKPKTEYLENPGEPWGLETPGTINPKLYPCCHGLATTIEYGILIREKYGISADGIREIRIYSAPKALSAMHSQNYMDNGEPLVWDYEGPPRQLLPGIPGTGKEAKFSKEYGFAAAFLYGGPRSEDFTDEAVRRSDVQELMQKVRVYHDCELDKISYQYPEGDWPYGERFVIEMKDGRVIREEQIFVLGAARRPLSMDRVEEKFRICASTSGLAPGRIERTIAMVEGLEGLEKISQLLRQFRLHRQE